MRKQIARYDAQYADGTPETIILYQDFIDASDLQERSQIPGQRLLRTASGKHVNRISKGKYEIVDFARTPLTSDDPDAL